MNTKQLEYFISLSETLNFTRTAQKFYISQTAVSNQIKALERSLDTQLFNRNKHAVSLTPAGSVFLGQAKAILYKIDEALERVHLTTVGVVGMLRIGFVNGYEKTSFSDLIYKLYNQYPNISMTFFRGNQVQLQEKLDNGELDIVFTLNKRELPPTCAVHNLKRYPLCVIVHPTHPLAARKTVCLEELVGERIFDQQESQDVEAALLMVSANMGIAIMPAYCVRYLNQSQHLMMITLEDDNAWADVAAVWLRGNDNPALPRMTEIIEEMA